MKIAVAGDGFKDRYCFGSVERVSLEAPIPILDVESEEVRGGGAINVANNVYSLGLEPTLFTITDMELPYEVVSPDGKPLEKIRYVAQGQQLLRVDQPKVYWEEDLWKIQIPSHKDFDLIIFADYNKGYIDGGTADLIDSKKMDLSVFEGSRILKINDREYAKAENSDVFQEKFITCGAQGITHYQNGTFRQSPAQAKEVIDISGAGDTVLATLAYCLAHNIDDPEEMMRLANKAAGIVISKFGTSTITKEELEN